MSFLAHTVGLLVLAACLQLLRTRYRSGLRAIPGPFLASFSNLWKVAAVWREDMPAWNMAAHEKYGPVVRIGPNHVSFASPEAFYAIHASRQAFGKVCIWTCFSEPVLEEDERNTFSCFSETIIISMLLAFSRTLSAQLSSRPHIFRHSSKVD